MEKLEYLDRNDLLKMEPFFKEKGYLFIPEAVSKKVVEEVESVVERIIMAHSNPGDVNVHDVVARLNLEDQNLLFLIYQSLSKSFALDKLRLECEKYIVQLMPDKILIDLAPGVLMGIPGDDRIIYDWHQEYPYHMFLRDVVHIWLPIFNPTSIENGTMSFLKGSHRDGVREFKVKEKKVPNSTTNLVVQNIEELKKDFPEIFVDAKPTDMFILDSELVHRSNTNSSNETRFIVSFRVGGLVKCPTSFASTV